MYQCLPGICVKWNGSKKQETETMQGTLDYTVHKAVSVFKKKQNYITKTYSDSEVTQKKWLF